MATFDPAQVISSEDLDQLLDPGYLVIDGFLDSANVHALREEFLHLRSSGMMKEAGIGNSAGRTVEKAIRGDHIYWLEQGSSATPEGLAFLSKIDELREFLRNELRLPLRSQEAHYAFYPEGTFYRRHLDQFQGESHRKFSFICYLNPDWKQGDGGELVIYPEGKAAVEVEPIGGRLAVFRSDLLEHEVLETVVARVGITGWMLDCEPGLRFL